MTSSTDLPLVYTAQSKRFFYCRDAVCEFVLGQARVPLHPFRVFDYFLGDRVARDTVRRGNTTLIRRCDAVWVFGTEIADGVLEEIALAHAQGKPLRFWTIATRAEEIEEVSPEALTFEAELLAGPLGATELREVALGQRAFARGRAPAVT